LVQSFRHWLKQHRGAAESTLHYYCRGAVALVEAVGDDPSQYDAQTLRAFILERARHSGKGATQVLITAVRSFLRYLAAERKCSAALMKAIPSVAVWRHTRAGVRDRAILLLLARLGLRASDVAALRLFDFDWQGATILVSGKSRREARLPLPQEVGDAILQYLEGRPRLDTEPVVFLRLQAPWQPLNPGGISLLARRAMRRAGVSTPFGAHILRHTAATQMLRQGVPLDDIRILLRHRSLDMTATYAKVDIELLRQVAQPWPEVLRCS
jgi:site-specific recombinase XerD